MTVTRRDSLMLALGGAAAAAFGLPGDASAASLEAVTAAFTGGAVPTTGGLTLTTPDIAENGNAVPVEVEAPGAVAILLLATENPWPAVATFTFGPAAGSQRAATRIRLARSQDVIALAKMADGSVRVARNNVSVTVGGCG